MSGQSFATNFSAPQSAEEVFSAICNVRGWWSEEIDGNTAKLGDEFSYHYKDMHRCTMRVTEAIPGKKMVWLVLDNYFSFTEDQTEWNGTHVVFEISTAGGETQVRFTHEGLVPEYECFGVCSNAWGSYINGSLKSLITTGKGHPNKREDI
jgi:hypothetical protein